MGQPVHSAPARDTLFKDAQVHFDLGATATGARPLTTVGLVAQGLPEVGDGALKGRKVARLSDAYLNAGSGLNVKGYELTAYLRARDPRGLWNYGLFNTRGNLLNRNFNPALPIRETVMHATSPDLIHWTKQPQDAFTGDGVHYDRKNGPDFRDPFVFYNPEAKA